LSGSKAFSDRRCLFGCSVNAAILICNGIASKRPDLRNSGNGLVDLCWFGALLAIDAHAPGLAGGAVAWVGGSQRGCVTDILFHGNGATDGNRDDRLVDVPRAGCFAEKSAS
jgi:hypothetical protein